MTTRTLTLLVFAACALAQPKPTLTPADCGKWETLGAGALSPDGKWLAYEIRRTSGNHELRVAATAGGGKTHVLAFCSGAAFSADSRYLACSATVSEAEQDRARKAGRPVQDKLNVLDLGSGEIAKVDDVQSLAFSGVGPYLAFRKYPPAGAGRGGDEAAPAAGGGRGGRGYATLHDGKTERAVFLDKGVSGLEKAKDADTFIYQSGAWDDSPNFFAAGADLKNATRVSDTNPFASQYAWGRAELIDYQNSHGDRLQGALYYPAPYEKGKQYPLIVQIYEIESNQLHNWTAPSERATYNAAVWTQHGYFVLRPDIVFKARDPGVSALDCVTAAVKKTLESGMIDARRVGLTGHSWGGYETTFIVTHSDLFAAGVVGGALTNLSSSVGEIYWNTGAPETNHVEVSQERMQVPLYEDPQSYILRFRRGFQQDVPHLGGKLRGGKRLG